MKRVILGALRQALELNQMSKEFTHLSLASAYSFKYGSSHPEQLVQRAAQFNMKSLALTDQNNLAGAIRFAQS